jgi:outer membrane protein assembly factor BamB
VKKANILRSLVSAAVCLFVCAAHADTSSTTYQADVARDGRLALGAGFLPPLRQLWSRDLGGNVSYPVIANGMVFVLVSNDIEAGMQLFALDLGTGKTLWQKPLGGSSNWGNLSYDNGRVFVANFDGVIQAFEATRTGKRAWVNLIPSGTGGDTIASGGQIFIGGPNGHATALSEKDGSLQWQVTVLGAFSSPSVDNAGHVFFGYPCQYYGLDPATGHKAWTTEFDCQGGGDDWPAYFNGNVYLRDPSGRGDLVLDAATGHKVGKFQSDLAPAFWQGSSGQQSIMTFKKTDGLQPPAISSVDLATGKTNWTFAPNPDVVETAPMVINDMVAVGTSDGTIHLFDAASGNALWSANAGAPILASNEYGYGPPLNGLGAGENMLFVPASHLLVAFGP